MERLSLLAAAALLLLATPAIARSAKEKLAAYKDETPQRPSFEKAHADQMAHFAAADAVGRP